jgi:hypothetical protein
MPSHQNIDLDQDKDVVLVSIYNSLDRIGEILGGADETVNLIEVRHLKDHSSDLLKHIFECIKDGDTNYIVIPKTPADLLDNRAAMLSHIDQDITHMRGYPRASQATPMWLTSRAREITSEEF